MKHIVATEIRRRKERKQRAPGIIHDDNKIMTTLPVQTPPRNKQARNLKQYTSPRCDLQDDDLFLPSGQSLKRHEDRWQHMQQQAGSHQQDLQVLDLTNRITSPQTLKVGVPPQVAQRIQELHVNLHSEYSLPEWLDVVCFLFFQLQHLYTTNETNAECSISSEDARMRRLYILYRLPDLRSIDGKHVTQVERQLARPTSPNGFKVKLQDWVVIRDGDEDENDESYSSEDDSSVLQSHGDAVEVSLFGVVKRVSADPPKEDWDEPELPKPFEPSLPPEKVEVNVTKSVERAHRSIRKVPLASEIKTPSSSCGGLAAAFAEANPCVASSRTTTLDEPFTVDYPTTTKKENSNNTNDAANNDARGIDKGKRDGSSSRSTKQKEKTIANVNTCTSPERRPRPTIPEANQSPSSLSSPFPMQFRSKSFNGTLPSTMNARLPRKMSSPDLSPAKTSTGRGAIHDSNQITTSGMKPLVRKQQQRTERPPPVPPGASRRVAPPSNTEPRRRRRGWRSKNSIRSTSIVDDEDEDCLSDDEDEIEHA